MKEKPKKRTELRIKGMGSGLCVTLNPEDPYNYLEKELQRLFSELGHLSVNARVFLDMGEKEGYDALEKKLAGFLKKKFRVDSVSRFRKKPVRTEDQIEEQLRKQDVENAWYHYQSDVLMLTGRVRSGQKVTARHHLVLLGDINPGGEVMAGGDILVIGSLRGTAVAGQPENTDAIILAMDFRPTQIQIGRFVAAGMPGSADKSAEFAHVEDGTIVVENYLGSSPFGKAPWPQVR